MTEKNSVSKSISKIVITTLFVLVGIILGVVLTVMYIPTMQYTSTTTEHYVSIPNLFLF